MSESRIAVYIESRKGGYMDLVDREGVPVHTDFTSFTVMQQWAKDNNVLIMKRPEEVLDSSV